MNISPAFDGRVLVIGLGSVSRCTLPLLLRHLPIDPSRYMVIDAAPRPEAVRALTDQGIAFARERITPDNLGEVLRRYVGPGDVVLDLAWNIETLEMLEWCRPAGVRYVNASIEVWDPYDESAPGAARTLYTRHMALRRMLARWGTNDGPSAVLDHGANPGLVSHFTKAALDDIAGRWLVEHHEPSERRDRVEDAVRTGAYNHLAHNLGVQVIHVSERDTQISAVPKREDEFVNTWSVEGFHEEGVSPAELGWGTHERRLPPLGHGYEDGPGNQIWLGRRGCETWVRSWVPCGEIVGMVIRHGEAFSISDHLTVTEEGRACYRPTVHYAYCPADAAVASLHELAMRQFRLQDRQRIMDDDIVEGRDELGVLLMGHPYRSWWTGSLLDIHESRRLVPGQNATTLQVAAGMLAAVEWLLAHPREGVRLPDELPHRQALATAKRYLGPFLSQPVDWSPLDSWPKTVDDFGRRRPPDSDEWQFETFLVSG